MLLLVEYNMYLQLGVAGLRALENYNLEAKVSFVIFSIRCKLTVLEMGSGA
jgi:hypothetical protein